MGGKGKGRMEVKGLAPQKKILGPPLAVKWMKLF